MKNKFNKKKKGFTLLEMAIVLAVIGITSTFVAISFWGIQQLINKKKCNLYASKIYYEAANLFTGMTKSEFEENFGDACDDIRTDTYNKIVQNYPSSKYSNDVKNTMMSEYSENYGEGINKDKYIYIFFNQPDNLTEKSQIAKYFWDNTNIGLAFSSFAEFMSSDIIIELSASDYSVLNAFYCPNNVWGDTNTCTAYLEDNSASILNRETNHLDEYNIGNYGIDLVNYKREIKYEGPTLYSNGLYKKEPIVSIEGEKDSKYCYINPENERERYSLATYTNKIGVSTLATFRNLEFDGQILLENKGTKSIYHHPDSNYEQHANTLQSGNAFSNDVFGTNQGINNDDTVYALYLKNRNINIEGLNFPEDANIKEIYFPNDMKYIGGLPKNVEKIYIPTSAYDLVISSVTSGSINNSLKKVVIEAPFVCFSNRAFQNCTALESLTLPMSWRNKGVPSYFISGCNSLKELIIPQNPMQDIKNIESYAFSNCSNLETLTLPSTITYIGENAISYCSKLTNLNLPANLEEVATNAFKYTPIENLNIGKNLSSLQKGAFSDMTTSNGIKQIGLKTVTINKDAPINTIPEDCFAGNTCLEVVTLSDNVSTIEKDAFNGCTNLKTVIIPSSIQYIDAEAFTGCENVKFRCSDIEKTIELMPENLKDKCLEDCTSESGSHSFVHSTELSTTPTCNTYGSDVYICNICERQKYEPIPPIGHNYLLENGKYICQNCNDEKNNKIQIGEIKNNEDGWFVKTQNDSGTIYTFTTNTSGRANPYAETSIKINSINSQIKIEADVYSNNERLSIYLQNDTDPVYRQPREISGFESFYGSNGNLGEDYHNKRVQTIELPNGENTITFYYYKENTPRNTTSFPYQDKAQVKIFLDTLSGNE